MISKQIKSPSIRFSEHTYDWEKRKLEDFGTTTGGTSIESEFSENGKYKVISIGSYSEDSVYNDQGIRAIESEKTMKRVLNKGDLTMILNDKTASGNIIGRALLIEESGVYVYNQRTERIEIDDEEYDSIFIYVMLNAPNIRDKIIKQAQGNTQIYVNWATIALTEYLVPKKAEQIKIGEYFQNLDNLITLHQRKYDKYVILKKSIIDKMFLKDGADVPEVRISGFEDKWQQRKLGEISEKSTLKNKDNKYSETLTNSAEHGIISQRDYFEKDISNGKNLHGYYIVHNDDFVYNPRISRLAPVGPIKRNKLGRTGVMSPLYYVFRTHDIDNSFLEYYFEATDWHKFMRFNGDTGARADRFAIKDSVFREMPIPYPSLEEQKLIGQFLDSISTFIDLHQRELEWLKTLKKTLLKQMFV